MGMGMGMDRVGEGEGEGEGEGGEEARGSALQRPTATRPRLPISTPVSVGGR